jgi:RHS repeat-associated protein
VRAKNRCTRAAGHAVYRARYYNPYICRFINGDPSGFGGGLNFYAFCNDNPISLEDPFGLGGTSWLSQLNLYGTMADLGAAGFQQGGVLGSLQGNFYSGATALLNTLGGQAVGSTANLSGTAAGNGNTGAAIGWGTASIGLIALNAYTGGQSAAAVGNLGTYAANPILYEIGSKTLPTTIYNDLGLEGLSQIDKGAIITDQLYGGSTAAAFFTPVATTAYGTTVSTGLTPGAAYLANWATQGINWGVNSATQSLNSSTGK